MEIPENPEWLGPFKGASHSFLDCETLALRKIDPALIEAAWSASDTRWFDYVRLHPVKALYYFVHCYGDLFGEYLERNIDHSMRFSRGLKGDALEHRELRSILTLKRKADELGMPYPTFLRWMFDWFASNGWTRPPRPAHMANAVEAHQAVQERWADLADAMTVYAKDPWYEVENWCGHEHQRRYEDWLIDNIRLRQHKELALSVSLYEKGVLRIERAMAEFDGDTLHSAQRWFDRMSKVSQR